MSTAQTSLAAAIKAVKNFDSLPTSPFCSGTFPWNKDKSTLFYKLGEESRSLNVPATNAQLKNLFNASSAGELDPGSFGMSFSPWHEGLVGFLEEGLLKSKKFRVDLPILKVYGPGGSPKADPKAPSSMIASLVIILPTAHKGGLLTLSQKGTEWTFDSSNAVSTTAASPQAAFMASYSNVKHRVNKVTSGHLVTLTYNFHRKRDSKKTSLTLTPEDQEGEPELQKAIDRLLNDQTFFPGGGFIGFGLKHKYPFVLDSTQLMDIKEELTGSDAAIRRSCENLSLVTSIKAVLLDGDAPGRAMLTDNPTNYNYQVDEIIDHIEGMYGGQGVVDCKQNGTLEPDLVGWQPIAWLKPLKKTNLFTFFYIDDDYKRPSSHDVEAEICLVAKIPPAEERDSLAAVPDTQAGSEPDLHQDKKRRLK